MDEQATSFTNPVQIDFMYRNDRAPYSAGPGTPISGIGHVKGKEKEKEKEKRGLPGGRRRKPAEAVAQVCAERRLEPAKGSLDFRQKRKRPAFLRAFVFVVPAPGVEPGTY